MHAPPNKVLEDIRVLVKALRGLDPNLDAGAGGLALAVLVNALDEWLTHGGHRPDDWAVGSVDLTMPGNVQPLYEEVDRVRDMLSGKHCVLPAATPQLVVATSPFLDGNRDTIVAALATHVATSHDPADAVRKLRNMLEETLKKIGQA